MPLTEYRVTLLICRADGEDVERTVHQEGWSANDAIYKAIERAREEEPEAEEIRSIGVV